MHLCVFSTFAFFSTFLTGSCATVTAVNANAATNRMMLEVSQASQDMVLEAAKASSTGVLDIETVRTLNESLINTLKTKNQLRIEGDKKLKNEGAEIARLHEELVQNLQTLE